MRARWSVVGGAAVVVALGGCGDQPSSASSEGIRVVALRTVLVTGAPLGDDVQGELDAGRAATAVCFASEARTSAGAVGAAVKIEAGGLSGYAAVSDFPDDPAERVRVFDVRDSDLRMRLAPCAE